jgi:WW domain-binding protein 2
MGSPWIGASFWEASVKPVPNGNISAEYPRIRIKLTFYDGGHSDWTLKFENIKGRLAHAAQIARETGQTNILNSVHDEQLPEYSAREGEAGDAVQAAAGQAQVERRADQASEERQRDGPLPDEPPPDYDEAQAQAVAMRIDERTQQDAERR